MYFILISPIIVFLLTDAIVVILLDTIDYILITLLYYLNQAESYINKTINQIKYKKLINSI